MPESKRHQNEQLYRELRAVLEEGISRISDPNVTSSLLEFIRFSEHPGQDDKLLIELCASEKIKMEVLAPLDVDRLGRLALLIRFSPFYVNNDPTTVELHGYLEGLVHGKKHQANIAVAPSLCLPSSE